MKAQAEKLRNVDLRKVLHTLGEKCFEQGLLENELPEQLQAIRDIDARIAEKREKADVGADETRMASLKRKGRDATSAGHAQALLLKREHLITELGRQAYTRRNEAGDQFLQGHFEAIIDIEERIREKEAEAHKLGNEGKGPLWKLGVAAMALVVLAIVGMVLVNVLVSGPKTVASDFADEGWTEKTFSEALEIDELQQRNVDGKLRYFSPNAENPVTGWVKKIAESSKIRTLIHLKSGVRDGGWAGFHKNGQILFRGTYKEGDKRGIQESWYENGQKESERLFEDTLVSVKVWKPNGEFCPETRVEGGNGKEIGYADDGKPYTIFTWENGKGTMSWAQKKQNDKFSDVMRLTEEIFQAGNSGSSRQDNSIPKNQNKDYSSSPDFETGFRAGAIGSNLPYTNREAYLAGRQLGEKAKSMPTYTQGYNQGKEHGLQGITRRLNPFNKTSQKVEWLAWDEGYSIGNLEGKLSR